MHLPRQMAAGFCPYCKRWLGKSATDHHYHDTTLDEPTWMTQKKVNADVFELLQATYRNPHKFGNQMGVRSMQVLLDQVFEGSISEFGRVVGVTHQRIAAYRDGVTLPNLSTVLSICSALNLTLVQFYSADFNPSGGVVKGMDPK